MIRNLTDVETTRTQRVAELSLPALAEAVISVRCRGHGFAEAVDALRKLSRARASSREFEEGSPAA